jgi:hypothetical protein
MIIFSFSSAHLNDCLLFSSTHLKWLSSLFIYSLKWLSSLFIYSSISVFLIWLIVFLARFTHSVVSRLIRLMSIIVFSAENDLLFVIESTELLLSWIHFISMISRLSYDCLRIITSIINRFFTMMFRRIRQSYKNFEFVTSMKDTTTSSILMRIDFNIDSTSKSWIIAKNSIVKTLRVIRLHFIENQCKIFAWVASVRQMT